MHYLIVRLDNQMYKKKIIYIYYWFFVVLCTLIKKKITTCKDEKHYESVMESNVLK